MSERRTDGVGPPSRLGLEHGFVGLVLFMSKDISECSPLSVQNVFAVQCILLIRSHHQVGETPFGCNNYSTWKLEETTTSTGKISNAVTSATCVLQFLSADTPPKSDVRSGHI